MTANLPDGLLTTVTPKALWTWDTSNPDDPIPTGYRGYPTKSGLVPDDLSLFCGVPLYYNGNTPTPMTAAQKIQALRWAEDWVEQETGILLTPTWVASPPSRNVFETTNSGMVTQSGAQVLGVDYDLEDAPYDFYYDRSQDEGWMELTTRYRPIRRLGGQDFSPIKNFSYQYPLLDMLFRVPPTWSVVDGDFGLLRLVPSANVQMLPLFALELSLGGFAQSLPGGLWLQYTAGLNSSDWHTRFSFMKQLVLAQASIICIRSIAGSISLGADSYSTLIDGIQYQVKYNSGGPYAAQIQQFTKQRDELLQTAISKVSGPFIVTI